MEALRSDNNTGEAIEAEGWDGGSSSSNKGNKYRQKVVGMQVTGAEEGGHGGRS